MLKITAVTGGRADWGLLSPVLRLLRDDPAFDLHIVVTGQHLMENAGGSLALIEKEGFDIASSVDIGLGNDDSVAAVTKALGCTVSGFAGVFDRDRPDLLLVLGDRYEIFGVVQAALMARVPVAHLFGGDVTEGAVDDLLRHAITKMSHLHFVTSQDARKRVIQMGENPESVYCVGSTGLDHIHTMEKMDKDVFFESIGFRPRTKNMIVTFHPVTLETNSPDQCREMLKALECLEEDVGIILTGSNADSEGLEITARVKAFAESHENACFHQSLGTMRYLNALRHVDVVVGNSSSGLYEAPSFGIPTVNIGNREKGRLKASTVIDCPAEKDAILDAIQEALTRPRGAGENPYGDGHSAARIVEVLRSIQNPEALCRKVFVDRLCD